MGYNWDMNIVELLISQSIGFIFGVLTSTTIYVIKIVIDKRIAKRKQEKQDEKYPGFKAYRDIAHQAATIVSDAMLTKKK
jgi:hypothetical protein